MPITARAEIHHLLQRSLSDSFPGLLTHHPTLPPPRFPPHFPAEDVIEEAWNSTLLQKRYAALVASIDFAISVSPGVPRSAYLDAGRARQVVANVVGVRGLFLGRLPVCLVRSPSSCIRCFLPLVLFILSNEKRQADKCRLAD